MSALSSPQQRRVDLVDAVLSVVADEGLDRATVRRVAEVAGVSIGTVQHWFPTKDDLVAGAFEEVVDRIRQRVADLDLGPDTRANLGTALHELLPLDEQRLREARVQVAFAARAATTPRLAAIQRSVLADVRRTLAEVVAVARGTRVDDACRTTARSALALVDGLALHAVSTGSGQADGSALRSCVDAFLDAAL